MLNPKPYDRKPQQLAMNSTLPISQRRCEHGKGYGKCNRYACAHNVSGIVA